jgi:Holliday junction resolvase RusA-like endonuclease
VSDAVTVGRLVISVTGRPAPQGSKNTGSAGQLREQSPYLPAWRAAVKRAAYEAYRAAGVEPDALPLLRGPVGIRVTFRLDPDRRPDAPPDLDKLLRATWDALTRARTPGRTTAGSCTWRARRSGATRTCRPAPTSRSGACEVGPYGEAAWAYRAAGWAGVLPLPPHAKTAPPGGYTGWAGLEPSGADVQTWVDGPQG